MTGDTARLRGKFSQAPKGNRLIIAASVAVALGVAAMPLMNKKVYDTEQKMAQLRDGQVGAGRGTQPRPASAWVCVPARRASCWAGGGGGRRSTSWGHRSTNHRCPLIPHTASLHRHLAPVPRCAPLSSAAQYVDPMQAKTDARNQRLQGPTFRKQE